MHPLLVLFLVALAFVVLWGVFSPDSSRSIYNDKASLQDIATNYQAKVYERITIQGNTITAQKRPEKKQDGSQIVEVTAYDRTLMPPLDSLKELGLNDATNPTPIIVKDDSWGRMMRELVPTLIGSVLLVVLLVFLFSRVAGGASGPMMFIKSRARVYDPEAQERITFTDVAGADEEKEDLREIVDFLKYPKKYETLGAKIPRGILMVGPPGTGKTLMARAVAGESNVPFFSISGSEFVEMFVGVGAARVRDLFKEAKEKAPSIIFIDEIDAIGKRRSPGMGGGHDEREQTLNQILTEMDGFDNTTPVIVLAATNRADVLDPALTRPGRFDRRVIINLPNIEDRVKLLEVHAKKKPFDTNIDWRSVAGLTIGMSGADIANILNEAAIMAGKQESTTISMKMIQQSVEKVLMGNTRKSSRMTMLEKRITAYHEVGHALVGKMLAHTDPIHKVSILSRGMALGVTWSLPEKDTVLVSKAKYLDELAMLYAGRASEEVFFGAENITTGASNDIERATRIARGMIMRYGFDAEL
jgi:cell division protease FtsH